MNNIILIFGDLNEAFYSNLKNTIQLADKTQKITFIIDTHDGGVLKWALDFLDWFSEIKSQLLQTEVKIYKASSTAAILALSLADKENRSIVSTGKFTFFLGEFVLDIHDLNSENFSPEERVKNNLRRWKSLNYNLIGQLQPTKNFSLELFSSSGKLEVLPEDCLEAGIVSQIL